MDSKQEHAAPYTTETVWDGGGSATGLSQDGQVLRVGEGGGWMPEQLVLFAAETSFMDRFLAASRSAGVEVLGYVSSGHLEVEDGQQMPRIVLRPCVVVSSGEEAEALERIARTALTQSVVGRLCGGRVRVALDVQHETVPVPPGRPHSNE